MRGLVGAAAVLAVGARGDRGVDRATGDGGNVHHRTVRRCRRGEGRRSGKPAPFTVKARGFEPYESVFIEQCNGRPPSGRRLAPDASTATSVRLRPRRSPTPTAAVTFLGDGSEPRAPPVRRRRARRSCSTACRRRRASPDNGLTDFRDCQVRVSSNNTAATDDQVFLHLQPARCCPRSASAEPGVGRRRRSGQRRGRSQSGSGKSASGSSSQGRVGRQSASVTSGSGSVARSRTSRSLVLVAAVATGGAAFVLVQASDQAGCGLNRARPTTHSSHTQAIASTTSSNGKWRLQP